MKHALEQGSPRYPASPYDYSYVEARVSEEDLRCDILSLVNFAVIPIAKIEQGGGVKELRVND